MRRAIPSVLLMLALLRPGGAGAHPNHGPTLGERYATLSIGGGSGRLVYGLTFTSPHGLGERREADTDGDGRISEAERCARASAFVAAVGRAVVAEVDGRRTRLAWGEPFYGPADAVRAGPLAVEVVATFDLPAGSRRVSLEDRAEFEGIYRTTVSIDAGPGVEIARAGRGTAPRDVERRLVFIDLPSAEPPSPRGVTVFLEREGRRDSPGLPWAFGAVGCVSLVLLALALAARRRRSRRERRPAKGRRAPRGGPTGGRRGSLARRARSR